MGKSVKTDFGLSDRGVRPCRGYELPTMAGLADFLLSSDGSLEDVENANAVGFGEIVPEIQESELVRLINETRVLLWLDRVRRSEFTKG